MSVALWNTDSLEIHSLLLTQIIINPDLPESDPFTNSLRLLILSHRIAHSGIPAFYLSSSPSYSQFSLSIPTVIVFDYSDTFSDSVIPTDFFRSKQWKITVPDLFSAELMDHFQRALTLCSLYRFSSDSPLYFTTFLLFRGTEFFPEAFLFQQVPVRREKMLCVRTVVQGRLECILDCAYSVATGSFVLLPPYEHPFFVAASLPSEMTLLGVDRSVVMIHSGRCRFEYLTKPHAWMGNFFAQEKEAGFGSPIAAPPEDFFSFKSEEVARFFGKMSIEREPSAYEIHSHEATVAEMIAEQTNDSAARVVIRSQLGTHHFFPSCRQRLRLVVLDGLSLLRFEFGFADCAPPRHGRCLCEYTECQYEQLTIPQVRAKRDGMIWSLGADKVCDVWERDRLTPISGPKTATYIVFCDREVAPRAVLRFFGDLTHAYRMMGFGKLSANQNSDSVWFGPPEEISRKVEQFFRRNSTAEFDQPPIVCFIIRNQTPDIGFNPPTIVLRINPDRVTQGTSEEMRTLAFMLYSEIRAFLPSMIGAFEMKNDSIMSLFFGFRYQPAFVLARAGPELRMHIAWDPESSITVWIDDIGSVLGTIQVKLVPEISSLINDLVSLLKDANVSLTLTVLGEGITDDQMARIKNDLAGHWQLLDVFAVAPAPAVQVSLPDEFHGDALIIASREQTSEREFKEPLATGYVVSRHRPSYMCSLYSVGDGTRKEKALSQYVEAMSHLSWLSVKPGAERRTISYPPHIAALLKRSKTETLAMSRFEFLPSAEYL
jgi:hypothetical protein